MKHSLTVAYVTARFEPRVEWFIDSLGRQPEGKSCELIIVDPFRPERSYQGLLSVHPKPTVWQGPHRLTKVDWWAASNARNTAICLCQTEWIAFVDDRSVLKPTWLEAIAYAMEQEHVVCGPYEKVTDLVVENGEIKSCTPTPGRDSRLQYVEDHYLQHKWMINPYEAPGEWTYGCSLALPLEWALQVNGFDETMDGSSGEDYVFGLMLKNNGYPIRYDLRMGILEDRTPDKLGPVMTRRDKGVSPNDKSHWLLNKLRNQKRAIHQWDLRQVQACALAGKGFPVSSWPNRDPYDGEPLSQMTPG